MASSSFLLSSTGTVCSHQPIIKHPSIVSALCSLPTSTLSMSKLSTCQAAPPSRVLSEIGLCLKPHTSETPVAWTYADCLAEGLAEQWLGASLPQKMFLRSHSGGSSEIMANHNTQLAEDFTALWHFPPNTSKCGCSPGSAGTFACGDAVWPLWNALQAGEPLRPEWHMDPSDWSACSWGFALLPHQRTTRHWALNVQALCSTVYRILVVLKPSPVFPSMVLGEQICCSVSWECFHSLSFSPATFGGVLFLHDAIKLHSPPFLFSILSAKIAPHPP